MRDYKKDIKRQSGKKSILSLFAYVKMWYSRNNKVITDKNAYQTQKEAAEKNNIDTKEEI